MDTIMMYPIMIVVSQGRDGREASDLRSIRLFLTFLLFLVGDFVGSVHGIVSPRLPLHSIFFDRVVVVCHMIAFESVISGVLRISRCGPGGGRLVRITGLCGPSLDHALDALPSSGRRWTLAFAGRACPAASC